MDLPTAERLISAADPKGLAVLKNRANDPVKAKAVAGQFAALLVQNIMEDNDGTAIPVAGTAMGGNIVSGLFASAMSQAVASGDKLGLADLLFRSIEAKTGATEASKSEGLPAAALAGPPAATVAAPTHHGPGFSLGPYWQDGGVRPPALASGQGRPQPGPEPAAPRTAAETASATARAASAAAGTASPGAMLAADSLSGRPVRSGYVQSFARQLRPMLAEAGRQLGVSPNILLAHAALETGWGRSVVGNNLFGIKAGPTWQGGQVTTLTHEYEEGGRVAREAAFRAYPSLDASVQDFVTLVGGNPRYQGLIGSGDDAAAYAHALVAGGYATDIDYGSKLEAVAAEAAAAFGPSAAVRSETGRLDLFATPRLIE